MIRNAKDFWTGLIYVFFGSSAILIGREYGMGTAIKMGPAYFPTILGGLLVIISAYASTRFRWHPTLLLAAGLTVFCALVFLKGLGIPLPVIGPWFGG